MVSGEDGCHDVNIIINAAYFTAHGSFLSAASPAQLHGITDRQEKQLAHFYWVGKNMLDICNLLWQDASVGSECEPKQRNGRWKLKIEIKNRWDGCVLFSGEYEFAKQCVEAAVRSGADLSGANLSGANLSGANLYRANLTGADLSGADLYGANLYGANLTVANLTRAYLSGANLTVANLTRANLTVADLSGANLYGAHLSGANLYGAHLSGAYLSGADLSGAYLKDVKERDLIIARSQICPEEGAFVGWKKLQGGIIAKLVIPHDAGRVNAIGSRKCRASKVFVHEIFHEIKEHFDSHTGQLKYIEGYEVVPDKFDESVQVECSHGIHFFLSRVEAENY